MGACFTRQKTSNDLVTTKNTSCCNKSDFERRIYPIIDCLDLSNFQKNIIRKRYVKLVLNYEKHYEITHKRYNTCRILISVGSMILPTLQTVQNNENVASFKNEIFWSAIGTSLTVMIANNLISMFTLDTRYLMYAITCEKLKAIGWQYFESSGMFMNNDHEGNYVKFWNEVEKIIKLQIISEFSGSDDKSSKDIDSEFDILEDKIKQKKLSKYDIENQITNNSDLNNQNLNNQNLNNQNLNNQNLNNQNLNNQNLNNQNLNNQNLNNQVINNDLNKDIIDNVINNDLKKDIVDNVINNDLKKDIVDNVINNDFKKNIIDNVNIELNNVNDNLNKETNTEEELFKIRTEIMNNIKK